MNDIQIERRYVALAIVMLFQLLDVATTHYGLTKRGKQEGNPLAALLMKQQGEAFAYVAKVSVILLLCLWKLRNNQSFALMAAVSAVGGVNNLVSLLEETSIG